MKKKRFLVYLLLHIMVGVLSVVGICSKMAAGYSFMSFGFISYYGLSIVLLVVYAFGWQQILKRIDLTAAYSARSASIIWGLFWSMLIFHEKLSVPKVIGIVLVFAGLIVYFRSDSNKEDKV